MYRNTLPVPRTAHIARRPQNLRPSARGATGYEFSDDRAYGFGRIGLFPKAGNEDRADYGSRRSIGGWQMKSQAKPASEIWKAGVLSKIEPAHTALLIIDLQRDFCSDDGALAALGSDVSPCQAVANRIANFLPEARGQVAFVKLFSNSSIKLMRCRRHNVSVLSATAKTVICVPGAPVLNCSLSQFPGDRIFENIVTAHFSRRSLPAVVERLRSITTVAVAGVDTHICVEGTVRNGYDLGYRMLVLSDLVATRRAESNRHENSLALCERYFALTVDSGSFLELLRTRSSGSDARTAARREQ